MIDLKELKKLDLPRDKFAVFGSGPMGIRGIRDSSDVDIIVKQNLWEELAKKNKVEHEIMIKIGNVEICKNWLPWLDDTEKLIDDADIIKGIRFVKLKYVLEWKIKFNRDKDKKDVELIQKYLKKK